MKKKLSEVVIDYLYIKAIEIELGYHNPKLLNSNYDSFKVSNYGE